MTHIAGRALVSMLLGASSVVSAQGAVREATVVHRRTVWPSVTAIATFKPQPYYAVKVEVNSDGWILVTPLSVSIAEPYPSRRVIIAPADARSWVAAVRGALEKAQRDSTLPRDSVRLPPLGRGAARLERDDGGNRTFLPYPLDFAVCRGYGTLHLKASELARLADIMEQAARAAAAFRETPRLPTLDRPYVASEVGCPAQLHDLNFQPAYPELPTGRVRPTIDVGVRFIVDTTGRVEPGSLVVLPGVPAVFAAAARRTVDAWRFTPATWSGLPVRQLLNVALTFDPSGAAPGATPRENFGGRPQPRVQFVATDDGWVRMTQADWLQDGSFRGGREWFAPDSLLRWLGVVDSMIAEDRVRPKIFQPGPWGGPAGFGMGYTPHTAFQANYPSRIVARDSVSRPDSVLRLRAVIHGCRGLWYDGETIDEEFVERARRAAVRGRALRRTPAPPGRAPYSSSEVACPATLAPRIIANERHPGNGFPSTGPYTEEMRRRNVRAEVMSSFVVDTIGRFEPGSLVIMPGTDPAVARALRRGIARYSFNPATRSGTRVRQRLVMAWTFVPPPICETGDEGVECPRRYGRAGGRPARGASPKLPPRAEPTTPPQLPSKDTVEHDPAIVTDPVALLEGTGRLVVKVDLGREGHERRPGVGSQVVLQAESLAVIPGRAVTANVGESGVLQLNGIAPGRYNLHVRRIGFERTSLKVRIVAGFADTVSVSLKIAHGCDIGCGDIVRFDPPPCATTTPALERRIAEIRNRLASPEQVEYRASLGIAHLVAPDHVSPETDDGICTFATAAVRRFTGDRGPATRNYVVLRAGSRFIVIDPKPSASPLFSVSARFDDVRTSLLQ